MAKPTTRRAISVKGTTYRRLKELAERAERGDVELGASSISGLVEILATSLCDEHGVPRYEMPLPRTSEQEAQRRRTEAKERARAQAESDLVSQHFTF